MAGFGIIIVQFPVFINLSIFNNLQVSAIEFDYGLNGEIYVYIAGVDQKQSQGGGHHQYHKIVNNNNNTLVVKLLARTKIFL